METLHTAPQHVDFWVFARTHGTIKLWAEWFAPSMTKLAATYQPKLMDGPQLSIRTIRRRPQVRPSDPRERRVAP
jgi:hypothetical protein